MAASWLADIHHRLAGAKPCTRFAPSTNGFLHLGHVLNAIYTWGIAQALEGEVRVRLEDNDRQRCKPEFAQAILEDLRWLGLLTPAYDAAILRQQDRYPHYQALLASLVAHKRAYPCACTRKDIIARAQRAAPAGQELPYDNHCRARSSDADEAGVCAGMRVQLASREVAFEDVRLGSQHQHPQQQCGDLLVRDKLGNYTYHLCVVVDDHDQGVNLIIRGEDLLDSTGRQLLLSALLFPAAPLPLYLHHNLICDSAGAKLSKTDGATGIRELRAAGYSPETVLGLAAFKGGLVPAPQDLSPAQLHTLFR